MQVRSSYDRFETRRRLACRSHRRRSCVSCYSICMAVFGLGPPRVRDASSCQQLQCERGLTHDGSSVAIEITVLIYNIAQAPSLPLSFRLVLIPSHATSCRLIQQASLRTATYNDLQFPWKSWWIDVPSKSILHRFIRPARKYNDEKQHAASSTGPMSRMRTSGFDIV